MITKKNFAKLSLLYLSKNVASWPPVVCFLQSDLFLKQNQGVYREKSKRKEKEILYGVYFDVGIHLRDKGVMLSSDLKKNNYKNKIKAKPISISQ